jgi:GntR family transcriptional regulator / MocR family aminotransferase
MKGQDLQNGLGQEPGNRHPVAAMNRLHRTPQTHPDHPLYRDVYQRLRAEILAGRLVAGARLPSSRTLAQQLGVARGTVEVAFQMLSGEGYTVAAGARGTRVNPALTRRRRMPAPVKTVSRAQRLRLPPGSLLFQMGQPALDVFPRKLWSQISARVVRSLDVEQLAHPHDIMGYEPLRHAIASYLRIARDIACSADQIMITAGFQGALGFIAQALLAPRDEVWVEDPGYFFAHELLRQSHLRLCPIPVDSEGIDVAAGTRIAPGAALAVVTPTHQFPLGMTLPVDRRLALLDWADRKRAFIVEDDYDCEFHHRGLPPPALKGLDRSGRVLYVGSFSKVLFPGLRLGYLVLPDALIDRFLRLGRATHQAPALMMQKLVEAFMAQGHFSRHLSRMRSLYTERRQALASALTAAMPRQLEIALQDGGMHFVAHLRGRTSDMEIVERLRRQGIGPGPLSLHSMRRSPPNGLMIGYPNVASGDATAAAQRMLAAMR